VSAWLAPDLYEAPARVNWLGALHMGTVLGTPYKVVLFLLGLVIAGLSVTGVVIWWRATAEPAGHASSESVW